MAVHSLAPETLLLESPDSTYSADDTGAWQDATVETLNSADEDEFISAKLGSSSGWSTRHWFAEYELAAPPTIDRVQSVAVRVLFDSYSANAVAVNLSLELFLVIGGVRYLAAAQAVEGSTPSTGRQFREFEATWSLNPATNAAFTQADLEPGSISAGLRFVCASDPYGAAVNFAGTGACCQVLEIEATGPSGANVEAVRHVLSSHLLRHRKMLKLATVDVPMQYGHVGILQPIWLAYRSLPTADGEGSGPEVVRRAPYLVLQKTPRLMQKQWRLKLLDPLTFARTEYHSAVTDITADAQDTGIARFDQGGGWSVARDQAGYVKRPPEGLWVDRQSNTPRYHKDYGLLVCGGGQKWSANNTFSQGSGGPGPLGLGIGLNYTGWTFTPDVAIPWDQGSTEAVRTEELFELLFAVDGLRRGVKLHGGYRPGYADVPIYANYTWSIPGSRKVRAFMKYKPDYYGPSRPKWMLVRDGTAYFVPGTGWSGTPTWNAPDQFGMAGAGPGIRNDSDTEAPEPGPTWEEFWSEEIDAGASPCTLVLRVGYTEHVSGAGVWPFMQTIIFGAAGLVESNGNTQCFPREFLVTTTADLVQEADDVSVNNDSDFRVWDVARGTYHFEVTWGWRHEDLVNGAIKILHSTVHATTGGPFEDRIFYQRIDADEGRLIFRRDTDGGGEVDATYTVLGDERPSYLRTDKIGVRWTSGVGELGLPTQTHSIFFNLVRGVDGRITGVLPSQVDGETEIMIGRGPGCTDDQYADCYFRHRETYAWPLSDAEMLRAMDY